MLFHSFKSGPVTGPFDFKCFLFQGKTESITVVKLLSCFDDLVAAGTASGRVAVFQLVSSLPGRNKQVSANHFSIS